MPHFNHVTAQRWIQLNGPILRLHSEEKWLPCSVDFFLQHSTIVYFLGKFYHPVTVNDLPTTPYPSLDAKDQYVFITDSIGLKGDLSTAKAYVHLHSTPTSTFTDFQFWIFYGYNGPGTFRLTEYLYGHQVRTSVADAAPIGEHYGDWELVVLRVDHATEKVIGVYLSQHGGGKWYGADQVQSLERFRDSIIIYPSRNGHANYPHVGENPTERVTVIPRGTGTFFTDALGFDFYLKNDTDHDTGPNPKILDCSQYFEIISFYDELEPNWINYKGRWGPQSILHLDYNFVQNVLKSLFGEVLGSIFTSSVSGKIIIDGILSQINVGDKNGPIGPKEHGEWSKFDYDAP